MARKPRKPPPAQASAPENDANPAAVPGHNGGETPKASEPAKADPPKAELTDEQKQILWFQAKKQIISYKAVIASKTAELRNVYKTLKADLGITKADAEFAIALDNDEDDKMLAAHRRRMELARWEQHPIGTQSDLFDGIDRTPAVDKAKARGKKDGLAGNPCDPQADPSTPQYGAYMEAFHEGNAELARGFIKAPAPDTEANQLEEFAEDALNPAETKEEEPV